MKILIIGNVGAGKTALANNLGEHLHFELCTLDDYRRQFSNGTVPGDYLAYYKFLEACVEKKNCILEFVGVGFHRKSIRDALEDSGDNVLVIFLDVPIPICKRRIKDRKWDLKIPHWKFNPEVHLQEIEKDLNLDYQNKFWEVNHRFSIIKVFNDEDNQIEIISQKILSII